MLELAGQLTTFEDLQKWLHKIFKKVGWLIIFQPSDKPEKHAHFAYSLNEYINQVQKRLDNKNEFPMDQMHVCELAIMVAKVKELKNRLATIYPNESYGTSNLQGGKSSKPRKGSKKKC